MDRWQQPGTMLEGYAIQEGQMMLTIKKQLDVRLSSFRAKLNSEGAKLGTAGLTMEATKTVLKGALAEAAAMMRDNSSLDVIRCDEDMKSVRLEFASPAARPKVPAQVFEVTNLSGFTLEREKATEAGTLNKEKSGRIMVNFKFTIPLLTGGEWAVRNFGDDLIMNIEKAQGEMFEEGKEAAEPAEGENSQEARNERIEEGEQADTKAAKKGKKAK